MRYPGDFDRERNVRQPFLEAGSTWLILEELSVLVRPENTFLSILGRNE